VFRPEDESLIIIDDNFKVRILPNTFLGRERYIIHYVNHKVRVLPKNVPRETNIKSNGKGSRAKRREPLQEVYRVV
jgi:hypothetical protein